MSIMMARIMKKMDGRVTDVKWGCQPSEESLFVPNPFFAKFQCIADLCWRIGHSDWFHAIMRSKCNIECWTAEIRHCQVWSKGDFSKVDDPIVTKKPFSKRFDKKVDLLKSCVASCSQVNINFCIYLYFAKGWTTARYLSTESARVDQMEPTWFFLILENS